jgi:magnesium-transporting ATPase (P-type)
MSLAKFLSILGLATGLCWVSFLAVIFFMNPGTNTFLAPTFFYLSLTCALLGSFTMLGYLIRSFTNKEEQSYKQVKVASRQALLFTILVVFSLFLQSKELLSWWNLLVLLALLGLIEMFFLSYKKYNR